ncbi:PREDICTED: pectinesterase inhibitor [Theobroma cacao]|uniref:Pectinesterase inhibitor n=1 Tax=Theobroma cacao TaxID=3641 RepID=A0AB32V785_THECC|nr:PREDICTED: pectinesterase inhibitor [Theobroma cacao]
MASYTPRLLALTLLVAFSVIHPSSSVPNETLVAICSKTYNPILCESILRGDPRTSSADLPELSLVSINLTIEQAANNSQVFVEFHDNTTDPALKKGFNSCVELYQLMEDNLDKAYHRSEGGDYRNITELVQSSNQAVECASALAINLVTIDALTRAVVSKCETSISVNQYIARSKA